MSLSQKDLETKRIQAATEKKRKIQQAKENLEVKRNQYKVEVELKRGVNGEVGMEAFNKTVAEIQSKIEDVELITCIFQKK